jgi:ribosomal protein L37AE/L43A
LRSIPHEDWRVEDHACSVCLGRILSREAEGGRVFRCADCGSTGIGSVRSVCACASKIGAKSAGIRCVVNPRRTPEMNAEIIAKETT